jgi:tetratricopeptide (TPR) repeat protein/VanZ family protein
MSAPASKHNSVETRSTFRSVCKAAFGDELFSQRMKLVVACVALLCLTYVLCVSDPWRLFGIISSHTKQSLAASDKLIHGLAYFVLSTVFMWYAATKSRGVVVVCIALALLHGVGTEIAQRFVPNRTFDLADIAADFLGVFLGSLLGLTLRRFVATDVEVPMASQRTPSSHRPSDSTTQNSEAVADADSIGLARTTLDTEMIREIQPRMLNLRSIAILSSMAVVVLGSVYAIHGWQIQRNAGSMLELGRKAQEKGNLKKAKDYFNRYVRMVPNDVNALADFGTLLDNTRPNLSGGHRVFMVYESVLRNEPTRDDIRRRQINVAMEIGRISDALSHATTLKQAHPKDGELHFLMGLCHERLSEFDKAADAFQQAIDLNPRLVEAYGHLALIEFEQFERPKRAHELFDELLVQNPENVDAWLARSLFRKDTGDTAAAEQDMQNALKLAKDDPRVILAAGELGYARANEAKKAGRSAMTARIVAETRELLQQGIQQHAGQLGLRLQLVLLESHFGNHDDALEQVDSILQESPTDARAHLLLADLTIEQGDFERAEEALKLLPRTPTSDALRLFLQGRIAMAEQHLDDAIVHFEKARRFMGESVGMLERTDLALARCHSAQQNSAAQLADFRRILKYNPKSVAGRIGLAASHLKKGQLPQAIAGYKQLSHLPQIRLLLVRLLLVQNMQLPEIARDWREIQILLDQAKEAGDRPTEVVLLQAETLALQGQIDDARHVIEHARTSQTDRLEFLIALANLAEKSGEQSQAALWMGQALAAVGNDQDAEAHLLKALESDPNNATAGQSLMRFYLSQNKREEAISVFQKVARSMSRRQLARSYALLGDLQQATVIYEQELKIAPDSFEILQGLSNLYLENGHAKRAQPLLERILDMESLIPESQLHATRRKLAIVLASQDSFAQFKQSMELLEKNRRHDGSFVVADRRAMANVLATSSDRADWQEAVTTLEHLEDQQQLLPNDRWVLGRLYDQLGQTQQATDQLSAAIESGTNGTLFVRHYVAHLIRHKKLEQANLWLAKLQDQEPDAIGTLTLDVYLKTAEGQPDLAVELLGKYSSQSDDSRVASHTDRLVVAANIATVANRDAASPALSTFAENALLKAARLDQAQLSRLVTWYIQQERPDDGLVLVADLWNSASPELAGGLSMTLLGQTKDDSYFDLIQDHVNGALKRQPRSLMLKLYLADLLSLKNEIRNAEELYRDILNVDRNHLAALNNLSWILALDGRHQDEALALIERAIEIAGPSPQFLDTRGCIYSSLGNTRNAVADFKQAIAVQPGATTWLHLSAAHLLAGEETKAKDALLESKRLGLDDERMHPLDSKIVKKIADSLR